jgi:hypothetical protein
MGPVVVLVTGLLVLVLVAASGLSVEVSTISVAFEVVALASCTSGADVDVLLLEPSSRSEEPPTTAPVAPRLSETATTVVVVVVVVEDGPRASYRVYISATWERVLLPYCLFRRSSRAPAPAVS